MWKPSLRNCFETMEARITSSGEGKVMGVMGWVGDGVWVMESSEYLFLDQGNWIPWEVKTLERLEV